MTTATPATPASVSAVPSPFVVVGEALVDIVVPSDGGEQHEAVGGSSLNVAVGLARLDVAATLVTRLGEDDFGARLQAYLRESDVALSPGSVAVGGKTSTATATLDADNAASYDFDLVWDLQPQPLAPDAVGLHVGSLGTTLQPGREAALDLVRQAGEAGVFVSYDPNIRPFFLEDPAHAWRDVLDVAAGARLVKLSDEDLRQLHLDSSEDDACRELLAGAATELVLLTRGGDGARAFTEGATIEVTAPPTQVVDTVGAGDSFMAATLAMLSDWGVVGDTEGALAALDDARVELLVRGAVTAAAITCSRRGANPPTRRELPPTWPAGWLAG